MNKLLICLFFLLPVFVVHAQDTLPLPDVAWTTISGELWLAGTELEPFQVAEAGACCAVFSPQGTRLAYILTGENGQRLLILNTANPLERLQTDSFPVDRVIGFLNWQSEDTLWLNLLSRSAKANLLENNWSPLRLDVEQDHIRVMPIATGSNTLVFASPYGNYFAKLSLGSYGEASDRIAIFEHENGMPSFEFEYPAVSSGSHLPWLPSLIWFENSLRFALPDPDILYAFDSATPVSSLIQLQLDGTSAVLGEAQLVYPAKVIWSPDGSRAAYVTPVESASQNVVIKALDSGEETVIRERVPLGSEVLLWEDWLVFSLPGEGIVLWSPDQEYVIPNVFGVTNTQTNGLVLAKRDQIVYWQNGEETPLVQGVSGLDVILAHGLLPLPK